MDTLLPKGLEDKYNLMKAAESSVQSCHHPEMQRLIGSVDAKLQTVFSALRLGHLRDACQLLMQKFNNGEDLTGMAEGASDMEAALKESKGLTPETAQIQDLQALWQAPVQAISEVAADGAAAWTSIEPTYKYMLSLAPVVDAADDDIARLETSKLSIPYVGANTQTQCRENGAVNTR